MPRALALCQSVYTGFQVFSSADKLLNSTASPGEAERSNAEVQNSTLHNNGIEKHSTTVFKTCMYPEGPKQYHFNSTVFRTNTQVFKDMKRNHSAAPNCPQNGWGTLVLVFGWTPKAKVRNSTKCNNHGFSVGFDNIFKNQEAKNKS